MLRPMKTCRCGCDACVCHCALQLDEKESTTSSAPRQREDGGLPGRLVQVESACLQIVALPVAATA